MAANMAPPRPQKRKAAAEDTTHSPKRARQDDDDNDSTLDDDISLADSTATSSSKRPKKYACTVPTCTKAFDRPARLAIHMRSHTNERPYVCSAPDCDKTFLRAEHLARHTKDKHSDTRDYACEHVSDDGVVVCGKSFTTATRLRRHVAAHEAKSETTCSEPGCGLVFRKLETLQRHIKTAHMGEKAFRCTELVGGEEDEEECGQEFTRPEALKTHIAREHSGLRYWCEICPPPLSLPHEATGEGVGFPTYADLQLHIRTLHPPTCSLCGKQCDTNRALKAHLEIEHSSLASRQTHLCSWPGCGRGFTKSGNLKVHMQSVHLKARDFVCGTFDLSASVEGWNAVGCGAAFTTKASLEEHVKTQHLGLPRKMRPSRLRKAHSVADSAVTTPSTAMDLDDEVETPADGEAMSMLTGFGYDALPNRGVACLQQECPQRFGNEWFLAEHLELGHGWNVEDVREAMAEMREEDSGGQRQFAEHDEAEGEEEAALRRSLTDVLLGGGGPKDNSGVVEFEGKGMQKEPPVAASGLFAVDALQQDGQQWEGMAIDPALGG